MQTKKQPLYPRRLTLIVAAAVADLLWIPLTVRGQALSGTSLTVTGSTTLQGNVSVTGTNSVVDFYGNSLYLGTAVSGSTAQSGISALYKDGDPSKFSLISARPAHQWTWEYPLASGSESAPLMTLDGTNGLTVYDTLGNAVVLSPGTMGVSGVATLLTQQAADSRYVSSGNFTVGWGESCMGIGPTIALPGGTATEGFSFAGINATASGYGSTASAFGSRATNWNTTATAWCSTASGMSSTATGARSTASGDGSTASGYGSTASGFRSTASGYGSTASGPRSNAMSYYSTASGGYSTADGDASTASGFGSTASGWYSTASGGYSIASGFGSTAAGFHSIALARGEFVVGRYNIPQGNSYDWVPTDNLFVVGNGSGESYLDQQGNRQERRSNAFVVKKNGDTTINGTLVVTGTEVQVTSGTTTKTKIVASGSNQSVLIPEQGDLSMGDFTNGVQPK